MSIDRAVVSRTTPQAHRGPRLGVPANGVERTDECRVVFLQVEPA